MGTTQSTGAVGFEIRTRYTVLTGCTVSSDTDRGIEISGLAHDCQVIGCSVHNCISRAISLNGDAFATSGTGVLRTTISGCDCSDNQTQGIRLDKACDYTTITSNTCSNNDNIGIYVVDSDHVRVTNNVSTNNNTYGIFLSPATVNMNNVLVADNDLTANGTGAILITEATGQVRGNSILRDNISYNPVGNITNPWPSATGDLLNAAGAQAAPTSAAVYTVRRSPKTIIISGGTITGSIEINGSATGQSAGVFKLGIGETIKVTFSVTPTVAVVRAE